MNKLTAEKCKTLIERLGEDKQASRISIFCELYLQALEIALPVLEQQGGWKLVPIEPTTEMVWAGKQELPSTAGWESFKQAYKAMLNASPSQPTTDTYRQIENDGREG